VELTKQFSDEQYAVALEAWSWVDLRGRTPRFTSLFGDLFLEADDGTWWFLSTMTGELELGWPSGAALAADLNTEAGQDRYLLGGLAMAAFHRRGVVLGADEVYTYVPPPVVSGSFDVDQIQVFTFTIAVNLAGQLHRQLRAPGRP
jgi:hypothetical protein